MTNRNMGDDGLNDTDIAAMFAADSTEPPAALDKLVLANAHAPVADIEDEAPFLNRYAPLFATTAVLLIAFAVTPFSSQAPSPGQHSVSSNQADTVAEASSASEITTTSVGENNSIQQVKPESQSSSTQASVRQASSDKGATDTASSDNTEIATEQLVQSAIVSRISADQEVTDSDATGDTAPAEVSIATSSIAKSTARSPASTQVTPAPEALTNTNNASESVTAGAQLSLSNVASLQAPLATRAKARSEVDQDADSTAVSIAQNTDQPFRNSPLLWVIEIKRLFNTGNVAGAREELTEFRKQHPETTHERLLPTELQAKDD